MLLNKLLGFFLFRKKNNFIIQWLRILVSHYTEFDFFVNFIYVTCLFMMTISLKPGSNAYFIIQKRLLNYNHALNHEINTDMEFNIKL